MVVIVEVDKMVKRKKRKIKTFTFVNRFGQKFRFKEEKGIVKTIAFLGKGFKPTKRRKK